MQNTPIKLATLATLLIGPTALADYPATVLASNPLAYYRFEEAPGATTWSIPAVTVWILTIVFRLDYGPWFGWSGWLGSDF